MVVTEFVFRTADVSGKMTAFEVVVPTRLAVKLLEWFQVGAPSVFLRVAAGDVHTRCS